MVNIEKYKNDGWGLSRQCFLDMEEILNSLKTPQIVEFGSGISTLFFKDYLSETGKMGHIFSFDNDEQYAADIAKIKRLVECTESNFEEMFTTRKYDFSKMNYRMIPPHTRQKNCFYDINVTDLPNQVDLAVIDGPHGNGRSFAFLHLKNNMRNGSYIVVDDYTHYDFTERLLQIFPNSEIVKEQTTGAVNQWELGGNYRIFKVGK